MKKKIIIIVLIIMIIALLLATAFFIIFRSNLSVNKLMNIDKASITEIYIIDSRNINEPVIIKDKVKIGEIYKMSEETYVKEQKNILLSNGWQCYIDIYSENKKSSVILDGEYLRFKDNTYKIIKGDFNLKSIDKIYDLQQKER